MGKPLFQSRTFWVNLIVILIMAIELFTNTFNLDADQLNIALFVLGMANILLRMVTTEPIQNVTEGHE